MKSLRILLSDQWNCDFILGRTIQKKCWGSYSSHKPLLFWSQKVNWSDNIISAALQVVPFWSSSGPSLQYHSWFSPCYDRIREPQNNSCWKGPLEASSSTSCSKQVWLDQVAQVCIQLNFGHLQDGESTTSPGICPHVWHFFVKKTSLESHKFLMFQLVAVGPRAIAVRLWDESGSIFSLPCDEVVADSSKVCPLPFFFQPGQTYLSFFLLTMCSSPDWIGGPPLGSCQYGGIFPTRVGKIPFAECPLLEAHKTGWCQPVHQDPQTLFYSPASYTVAHRLFHYHLTDGSIYTISQISNIKTFFFSFFF